jgi:hypothetical protein
MPRGQLPLLKDEKYKFCNKSINLSVIFVEHPKEISENEMKALSKNSLEP